MSVETWHSVVGLGADGGEALADGDRLGRGVHLRWALHPGLGFPAGGYHVSRREHRDAEWVSIDADDGLLPPRDGATSWEWRGYEFDVDQGVARLDPEACGLAGAVHLPGRRSLGIRAPRAMAAVRAAGVGPPPLLEVFAGSGGGLRPVARARATQGAKGWTATVWADGIVGCRLVGRDMRICEVRFGIGIETGGWRALHEDPLLLPVVAPGTANDPTSLHGTEATRGEAFARLSETLGGARGELAAAFAAAGPGELLEALLHDGRGARLTAVAAVAPGARTAPELGMTIAQVLALTALDPDVARMFGLYWHDPVTTGVYDYRVVAHHGDVRYPGRTLAFGQLAPGPLPSTTLALEGATFVGTGGLEILAPSGSARAALRLAAPRIGTAAGIRITPRVPAVTLRLQGSTPVAFDGWRGSDRVASGVAFLGVATLEDAGGLDCITWSSGPVDLVEVELHEEAGVVGDLAAHAWRLAPASAAPVHALVLEDAGAATEPARLHPDGTVDGATGVVGLDWGESSPVHDAGRPVRAHVGRATVADGDTPVPTLEVRNADRPAPAFADTGRRGRGGPDVPWRWRERGLETGWYGWSVRGIDLFGRLGEWSAARRVRVAAGTVPPPPDAVAAAYLDPADPQLTSEQRTLVEADGPGLLVRWTWPAERRVAAPGVEPNGEFRVYVHRGDPNLLEGTVRTATDLGDHSRLATDRTLPGAPDALAGERLRVGRTNFPVLANTTGPNAVIEVAHLAAPTARPTTGPFTVNLSESSVLRTDLTSTRAYDECVHVEPVGTPVRVSARIASVADGPGTATVTLDRALPAVDALPGRLVAGGIAFRVLGQAPGSDRIEVAAATQVDGSTVVPTAGEGCTVWTGAAYQVWLPGIGARPSPRERLALTLVGVSTCDVDAVVFHDPVPPGPRAVRPGRGDLRPGLEGPVSPLARVSVPHRHAPPAVPVELPPDGDIPADRAEPADWYGRARYDLAFAAVPGAVGYRVARASLPLLFARDRGARQAGVAPYEGGPFDDAGASESWLAEHHPSVGVDDLTADLDDPGVLAAWRDWSAWYYPQKLNREVLALAELPCNADAFRPAHEGTIAGSPFADTLDGRGLGRFVYRLRAVDASGNAGAWSAAFPLVEVTDVTPPATPVLLSLLAGENRVTAQWLRGAEPDLAEYRVWRAESPEALDDVRRLAPLAVVPAGTASPLTWSDEGLAGLRTYCYRVAAVDSSGNVSQPSPVAAVRVVDTTPPAAPIWVAAEWIDHRGGRAVRLAWRADEAGLTCVVSRRPMGGGIWAPVSPGIGATSPPFGFVFLDLTAEEGVAYEYHVRADDAAGNASGDLHIQPLWPA